VSQLVRELRAIGRVSNDRFFQPRNARRKIGTLLHLRQSEIQLVSRRRRQLGRVIENDFTAVSGAERFVDFIVGFQKIDDRRAWLDEVIRHNDMNRVIGTAFGHVTVQTRGAGSRTLHARHRLLMDVLVTTLADRYIVLDRLFSTRDIVGIVTRRACHLAALETGRLAQSIRGAGDLELVVVGAWRLIEIDEIVRQRVPRDVGEGRPIVAANLKR